MPTAIVAGIPANLDVRVKAALRGRASPFPSDWDVAWLRSKNNAPGIAPGQTTELLRQADAMLGAHVLLLRGRDRAIELEVRASLAPYFRVRWVDSQILMPISSTPSAFFSALNAVLADELDWAQNVKPRDEACCLLLPQCAFLPGSSLKSLWETASLAGPDAIAGAARMVERFSRAHWVPNSGGQRAWVDSNGHRFDHRGARHGVAPFPRAWKWSHQLPSGFHYDVTSDHGRAFHVLGIDQRQHTAPSGGHVNMDPHGYVR